MVLYSIEVLKFFSKREISFPILLATRTKYYLLNPKYYYIMEAIPVLNTKY